MVNDALSNGQGVWTTIRRRATAFLVLLAAAATLVLSFAVQAVALFGWLARRGVDYMDRQTRILDEALKNLYDGVTTDELDQGIEMEAYWTLDF